MSSACANTTGAGCACPDEARGPGDPESRVGRALAACRTFGKAGRPGAIRLFIDRARPGKSIGLPNTAPDEAFVIGEDAGFKADRVAGGGLKQKGLR